MSRRILVVAPYPPRRDGIGSYAVEEVATLRREGHHVEVCSPAPSAAHHHRPLVGLRGALHLRRLAGRFDRLIVHFHPDLFYPHPVTAAGQATIEAALAGAFGSGPAVELRIHETHPRWAASRQPVTSVTRAMLAATDHITVHSPGSRALLLERFGLPAGKVEVIGHGSHFVPRTPADHDRARASLPLAAGAHQFLCIGFLQDHKGFDRAVRAYAAAGLGPAAAELHVVGSRRLDDPRTVHHVDELRRLCGETPGAHLHEGYLSDEAFDRWIVAADTLLLPYREIWSSSVAERAALFARPVIATRVGGLGDQLAGTAGAVLVDDDAGLAEAMATAAGSAARAPARPSTWPVEGGVERDALQSEVVRRAAVARGGPVVGGGGAGGSGGGELVSPSAPLRRLRPLQPPEPVSARPGVGTLKRLIRRLVGWEVGPVAEQLNRLHRATIEAVDTTTESMRREHPR